MCIRDRSKALKADDRQIISCHDLKAAREQLLCGGVSLILLDINLPDGSGLELLREVKENMPGVPVILLTANDTCLLYTSESHLPEYQVLLMAKR